MTNKDSQDALDLYLSDEEVIKEFDESFLKALDDLPKTVQEVSEIKSDHGWPCYNNTKHLI